jgi:hypothetical protein
MVKRYQLKDGKFTVQNATVTKSLTLACGASEPVTVAPYIKLQSAADRDKYFYLFIGSAKNVIVSSAAPVGTSGAYTNPLGRIGTAY